MDFQIKSLISAYTKKTIWSLNNNYCQTLVVLGDVREKKMTSLTLILWTKTGNMFFKI